MNPDNWIDYRVEDDDVDGTRTYALNIGAPMSIALALAVVLLIFAVGYACGRAGLFG